MIKLGEIQKLIVIRYAKQGLYLNSSEEEDREERNSILLPTRQVAEGVSVGDSIEVFVYRDSEDRLIATTNRPGILLDELAVLEVISVADFGAFLSWGLEKDLFLPFKEQAGKVKVGDNCLVCLYIDKSERLCATMRITKNLRTDSPYKLDDIVNGTIYSINSKIGGFVAVDDLFHGLIPRNEFFGNFNEGDVIEGRVTKVREDGKLELSVRERAHVQMDSDSTLILERLEKRGGKLPLNDKSKPTKIKDEFQMSKKAFKRAVGRLMKYKKIIQTETGIELIKK